MNVQPFQVLKRTLQWIATEIILSMLKINFWAGAGTIVTDADCKQKIVRIGK